MGQTHRHTGTGMPTEPGTWQGGVGGQELPPSAGTTSHQLGFCIKLEVLDSLAVLQAVFQFHYLVLELNVAPARRLGCGVLAHVRAAPTPGPCNRVRAPGGDPVVLASTQAGSFHHEDTPGM